MAYLDKYGMVALEQCPWPGNIGDSCADSFRRLNLKIFVAGPSGFLPEVLITYRHTTTPNGDLRHPTAPEKDEKGNNWKEPDFSGDQWIAKYRCLRACHLPSVFFEVKEMEERLKSNWYRYGNNDFAHPATFSSINRGRGTKNSFNDLPVFAQAVLLTKFKYRWDDHYNCFRETENSSADWLNFLMHLIQCEMGGHTPSSQRAKEMIDPNLMWEKVKHYWKPEPNNEELLLDYELGIKKLWGICGAS